MIRIFCGCAPNNEDLESQACLEFLLRKYHPADDLQIEWMQLSRDPASFWYSNPEKREGWNTRDWATPFSGFRWAVPAACGYEGKAIYLDSDLLPRADIAELHNQPFLDNKAVVISKAQNERFCVSVFECSRMKKYMPDINALRTTPGLFRGVRHKFTGRLVQKFQGNWNCMDDELRRYKSLNDPDIKMLHYTDIPTQLHLKYSMPRLAREGGHPWYTGQPKPHPHPEFQKLFDETLAEAIANGFPPERYRKEPFGPYKTRWAA